MDSFNRDSNIKNEIAILSEKFSIRTIIETGTYLGQTTDDLADMVANVITIESNETYFVSSKKKLANKRNVQLVHGNSPSVLRKMFSIGKIEQPILFYLDAHWYQYNPLLDELKEIANAKIKNCVIAIHDFQVPEKDFGFDKFADGTPYCFEKIEQSLKDIYGENGFNYYYNNVAEGANRGIIYIHPKL